MYVCNYILELLGRLMVMMWIWEILHWSVAQNSVYMFQVVKKLGWGHKTWETVLRDEYKVFRGEHEVVRWQQVWREALFQGRIAKSSCLWSSWPPLRQLSFCAVTGHMGPLMTILQEGVTPPPFYKGGTEAQRTLLQVLITHRWWNQPLDPPKPRLTHPVQAVSLEARCSQSNPNGKCHIRGPPALLLNILILSTGSNQPGDLVLSD